MASVEQLAYDLALRALNQQEASLVELRARTGTLLAASSLTASFLGAPALREGLDAPSVLALIAFVTVVVLALTVLLPKGGFVFAIAGPEVHRALSGRGLDEAHRRLADWIDTFYAANQHDIDRLLNRFEWACLALVAQIVLLASAVAIH